MTFQYETGEEVYVVVGDGLQPVTVLKKFTFKKVKAVYLIQFNSGSSLMRFESALSVDTDLVEIPEVTTSESE